MKRHQHNFNWVLKVHVSGTLLLDFDTLWPKVTQNCNAHVLVLGLLWVWFISFQLNKLTHLLNL